VETVERDLAALWREAGQGGGLSRALMSNLVVVSPERTFPVVEEIARRHPARTILLSYAARARDDSPPDIRIGLHTFGDAHARFGLEFIAVHASCSDAALGSIVRRLTIGSVPTSVWWTSDLPEPPPEALSTLGRQLVYDSLRWHDAARGFAVAADLLDRSHVDLADLNWRRLAPLRTAIVQAMNGDERCTAVAAARISHAPAESTAAWLLAGWLRARTGVQAAIDEQADEHCLVRVTLACGGASIEAQMTEHAVQASGPRPPFTVSIPAETEVDAVAEELLNLGPDRALCEAVRTARALLGA
jgi:glucose-6-phosphate dehydrogenase assembly protein OpcA